MWHKSADKSYWRTSLASETLFLSVYIITTEQHWSSPVFIPLATGCHYIHIPLLFSKHHPLLRESVWNPFIVTAIWHCQCTRGPASSKQRGGGKKYSFLFIVSIYRTFCSFFFFFRFGGGELFCLQPAYFKWRATRLQHMGGDLWEAVKTDKTQLAADATFDAFFFTLAACLLLLRISMVH